MSTGWENFYFYFFKIYRFWNCSTALRISSGYFLIIRQFYPLVLPNRENSWFIQFYGYLISLFEFISWYPIYPISRLSWFRFSTKISIFHRNIIFLFAEFVIFWAKFWCLDKILIFGQHFDCLTKSLVFQKFRVLTEISIA